MNEKEKQDYLTKYKKAKEKGVPFFPNILFKDALVAALVFLILGLLAYFVGAPLEDRADPADTNYTPRPEWYFVFLFQLLKYFPGELEVIGVVVLPTIAIILLLMLPFLDRGPKRHFKNRRLVTTFLGFGVIGVIGLTVLSIIEAPPPAQASQGDKIAALYTDNCSTCHGPTISVPEGSNLHAIIAQGKHQDMPAWNADLTNDQIDGLAGFILSPGGSTLFTENCNECHTVTDLVSGDPLELTSALDDGIEYPGHMEIDISKWAGSFSHQERTSLLNFLVAPDGQRLYAVNCAQCHGRSPAFSGSKSELENLITQGGLHLEMPSWREKLTKEELDILTEYVISPSSNPDGAAVFEQFCITCHGERVPKGSEYDLTREVIASGGSHETMPVWGEILTSEQMTALVSYAYNAASGVSLEIGQELFSQNCSTCHGEFGEGGLNPARADDIIAPISTSEYLKTRDDFTLKAIVSQGQPNFGMSPFGSAFGGPLDDEEVDAIVSYMRSWESNPPVELPPEVVIEKVSLSGGEIFDNLCAQCHASDGSGYIGPSLNSAEFQANNTAQDIFDTINFGHEATPMISWGDLLSQEQIQELTTFITSLKETASDDGEIADDPGEPVLSSFSNNVMPLLEAKCVPCHGNLGEWDGTTYDGVMTTGVNAPNVVAGDAKRSILIMKLLGTQEFGTIMPPGGIMTTAEIQIVIDWVDQGALDN